MVHTSLLAAVQVGTRSHLEVSALGCLARYLLTRAQSAVLRWQKHIARDSSVLSTLFMKQKRYQHDLRPRSPIKPLGEKAAREAERVCRSRLLRSVSAGADST
jgi:hypothetical protein